MHLNAKNLILLVALLPFISAQPTQFIWGVALSEYQNSGAQNCPHSNWARWEATTNTDGTPHIEDGQTSGKAADFWHSFKEDIALAKDLGVTSLRLSIEWSIIEPAEGLFNDKAIMHYEDVVDELLAHDIIPMITLHHFTHPYWFDAYGGFEQEENISYFVRFCTKIFDRLGHKVPFWVTINEPTVFMFQGYIRGVFPPGKTSIVSALHVVKNMLKAHVEVYRTLKAMPHGNQAQIGFNHQYLKFKAYNWYNPIEQMPGLMLNNLMNGLIFNFLRTGEFKFNVPFLSGITYQEDVSEPIMDFFALNFYSRVLVGLHADLRDPVRPTCYPDEYMTDMPYGACPESLYDAIADVAQFNVPIYITENGIADKRDHHREQFINDYCTQVERARNEGYDVRGFYYWSLMDNFEWDMGYNQSFGLYEVDFETQKRTLRDGAKAYQRIAQDR